MKNVNSLFERILLSDIQSISLTGFEILNDGGIELRCVSDSGEFVICIFLDMIVEMFPVSHEPEEVFTLVEALHDLAEKLHARMAAKQTVSDGHARVD